MAAGQSRIHRRGAQATKLEGTIADRTARDPWTKISFYGRAGRTGSGPRTPTVRPPFATSCAMTDAALPHAVIGCARNRDERIDHDDDANPELPEPSPGAGCSCRHRALRGVPGDAVQRSFCA